MNSLAHIIFSMYSDVVPWILSIVLSSVEMPDCECCVAFFFFFLLAVGVICKFCTYVYISNKLVFLNQSINNLFSQTCHETAGLASQAPRGNVRGTKKAALDWNDSITSCLKAQRNVVCVSCPTSIWSPNIQAIFISAKMLSLPSSPVNHQQWYSH